MHSINLFSTPWPFLTGKLSQVSKNDDENTLLVRVIWLYIGQMYGEDFVAFSEYMNLMQPNHSKMSNCAYDCKALNV